MPNVVETSPFVLSHDERRLAFVVHERGEFRLAVRQLYDPGPDRSLPLSGGVIALAWSPDDRRIIFLAADSGAFWVCEPESGKTIPLPIPVLGPNQRHNLVWWRDEDVLVYRERGDTGMLSLDSLRIKSANEVPDWVTLTEEERSRIGRTALAPELSRTEKVKFAFASRAGENTQALTLDDDESLYARLAARASRDLARSFPNRDGTMFFIVESQRLRILYMGLRQSPQLRFVCEAKEGFPSGAAVSAALASRAIRAVVAAPVVNPLNGKTVDGDPAQIRGVARIIAASDKTCTVCIEQEWQPAREGDVLFGLTAIQDNDEFYVSRGWWAVLTKADINQSIPRRADVPALPASPGRELRPLPEPIPKPPPPSAPSQPQAANISAAPPPTTPLQNSIPPTTAMPEAQALPARPIARQDPPPKPQPETDEEKIQRLVTLHHESLTKRDLDAVVGTYGAVVHINGKVMTREEIRQRQEKIFESPAHITEKVSGPIEVTRGQNNRFSASYTIVFDVSIPDADDERGEASIDMDVLLTGSGPKIVSRTLNVFRNEKVRSK